MLAIKKSRYRRNWLVSGSLLLLSLTMPLAAQPLFKSAPASPLTGARPRSVAVGDFNGDGKADLATANTDSNDVTVFLGSGAGRFTAVKGSPFPVGSAPQSVAVGDLNGDGSQDLVIANAGGNTVTVLLGDGAGAFLPSASSPVAVGLAPAYVAIGDLNGDGKQDLAIANGGNNNVTVLLGDGAGRFTPAPGSPFKAGTNPQSVALGDLNGDGHPDLAIANAGSNTITVLWGNGVGGFTPAAGSPFVVGAKPQSVAVGDFNGDGRLDLATANAGDQTVTVLLATAAGGFTPAPGGPMPVESGPQAVAVGDFNGDGKLDLATANAVDNSITVLLGDGKGAFEPAAGSPFAVGSLPASVAVGDFNGDGKLDLAAALGDDTLVAILLNKTLAEWTTFHQYTDNLYPLGSISNPQSMAMGDFNNDGRLDLAVTGTANDKVAVMLGNDSGGFAAAPGSPFRVGSVPESVAVGDFNGDGKLDMATVNSLDETVTVLLGDGKGGFTEAPGSPFRAGSFPQWLVVADFNGDGKLDLATADTYGNSSTVLLGDGKGGFAPAPGSPFRAGFLPQTVVTGDFNGDGKPDLILTGGGDLAVLLGDGAGGFATSIFDVVFNASSATAGDFNGDGKLDLAITFYQNDNVAVLLGDGAGRFTAAPGSPFATGTSPHCATAEDIDGDGKLDLVTVNWNSNDVTVLLGDGTGGFAPAPGSPFLKGTNPRSVAAGDVNRDGRSDLAVGDTGNRSVRVLRNTVLQSIGVSPATATVAAGQTRQFTATGRYSDTSTDDMTALVKWSSSNGAIATTSNSAGTEGMATAVSGGPATITAALAGLTATASLSVPAPTLQSIAVSPATASVLPGATLQFKATGHYSDNSTKDLTASVSWSSSSAGIVNIGNSAGAQGLAVARLSGSATITAALNSINGTAAVTVPALQSVAILPGTATVAAGHTQQFTAMGRYANGSTQDLTESVTWSSANSSVTISNSAGTRGLATGVKVGGPVTVRATMNAALLGAGITGIASLTVTATAP